MDPVVIKAWLDIAGEALELVFMVVLILGLIKLICYAIKHPD